MKSRNLQCLKACCFVLATLIVSCGLQPRLQIEQHQVCSNSNNAASQCRPIGGNQVVLIQNAGASLKLYPLQADSLVDPNLAAASATELHEILSAHEMLLDFDRLTTSVVWRRHTLDLVDAGTANKVRLSTDPSISFLLIQAPSSRAVAIAAIKREPCSDERNIVAYLDSLYRIDQIRDEVVFYTAFNQVMLDGGLGILVIDPIITDDRFQVPGIRNYRLLDVGESQTQAQSNGISYFVPIATLLRDGSRQRLQPPALKAAVHSQALFPHAATTWADADFEPLHAYPMENTSITACNSVFTFTVAGKLKLIIDATQCPFKIVSNRDQLRYEVHILKGRSVQLDNDKR